MPDPIYTSPAFTLYADRVTQAEFIARALSSNHLTSDYGTSIHQDRDPRTDWQATDLPTGPTYSSDQPIVDALFNLAREEAARNVEQDGTLRTGAKWSGVWTRDVSYSALLGMAIHDPEAVKTSLRKKVSRGRIVQDTGTGGAWPVSSDRTTWALAAWEVYLVTGERDWLEEVYPIITATLADDRKTLLDPTTKLYRGESSFLDWREQTYPRWMEPMDIYASLCLGTNVIHYRAHAIAAEMARLLGEPGKDYTTVASKIKSSINERLWLLDKGYYAQYLYGRAGSMLISPRFEALGDALAVLYDVADPERAASILENGPHTPFGVPCIFPQIPDVPPYHNNSVWPFVQSFWNLAAARTGNGAALTHGLACLYRAAALPLSNYENLVAETGGVSGTEVNSHRMLWSIAGNLAMVYRVFMGMRFRADGLLLAPVVPEAFAGERRLKGFRYRGATLDITVVGFGRRITGLTIDGKSTGVALIPGDWTGHHTVRIELANEPLPYQSISQPANRQSLSTPWAGRVGKTLNWTPVVGAHRYRVYRRGQLIQATENTSIEIDESDYGSYQVTALDEVGHEGFAGPTVEITPIVRRLQAEEFAPASDLSFEKFTGGGFIELSLEKNRKVTFVLDGTEAGDYLIDFRFSNGSGPVNTDNKCAIRSLSVNGEYLGAVVFPQGGVGEWSKWQYSNSHRATLGEGRNELVLHFEDWNHNMDGKVNRAMLDYVRLVRVG